MKRNDNPSGRPPAPEHGSTTRAAEAVPKKTPASSAAGETLDESGAGPGDIETQLEHDMHRDRDVDPGRRDDDEKPAGPGAPPPTPRSRSGDSR